MAALSFLDLLGVATSLDALANWPRDHLAASLGATVGSTEHALTSLIDQLQATLEFHAFRPGAGPDRVGFTAEARIRQGTTTPLVAATMPDVGFYLEPSGHHAAHVFVSHGPDVGLEVVVSGVPIRIALPIGFLSPGFADSPDGNSVTDLRITEAFDPDALDSLEVTLSDTGPSTIRVRANLRFTHTGDVLVQPVVPISIGPCRFSGLPCAGLHDVQLFPTLRLGYVPAEQVRAELPLLPRENSGLGWIRYRVESLIGSLAVPSAIVIRTVDLDPAWPAYQDLSKRLLANAPTPTPGSDPAVDPAIDLVLEDIVMPLGLGLPIPLHGRFALRRRITGADAGDRYNLDTAPVRFSLGDTQLVISRFLIQTQPPQFKLEPGGLPTAVETAWVSGDSSADANRQSAKEFNITEDPALEVGVIIGEGSRWTLFTVAGSAVKLAAYRTGMLLDKLRDIDASKFYDVVFLVGDFEIDTSSADPTQPFVLRKRGEPGYAMVRGLGWKDGLAFGSLYDPNGLDLVAFRKFTIKIIEAGIVVAHDHNYLTISATLENAGGLSIHVRRLRFRLHRSPPDAPDVELDGLDVAYTSDSLSLDGFLFASNYERDGVSFQEIGGEINVKGTFLDRELELDAQLLFGTARGAADYDFCLVSCSVGPFPIGAMQLTVEALFARDFVPALPPPVGDEPALRLFHWYQSQGGDPLAIPLSRKLDAWAPEPNAIAVGVGAKLYPCGTTSARLEGFLFYRRDIDGGDILGGLELYLFKSKKPAAFLVFEDDLQAHRWSLAAGLDLSIDQILGSMLAATLDGVHVTGSGYYCSSPHTLAIGQYPDPTTWLACAFTWAGQYEVRIAGCYHRIDDPDPNDPTVEKINVLAITGSFKGTWAIEAIASDFQIYVAFTIVENHWRTAAIAAGLTIQLEAAVRLKLFGWFRFGADVQLEIAHLGPEGQRYTRYSMVIRVETPWYLPDVTVRWETTSGEADPAQVPIVITPVTSAGAFDLRQHNTQLPAGAHANLPDGETYSLAALRAATPIPASDADFAALVPVATNAMIAIDFGATVEAIATVLPPAVTGASHQRSGELHTRYALVSIGIRRRARFGTDAGVWTDLLSSASTTLPPLHQLPANPSALFGSPVHFAWDADSQRLGRLDARRLLINADTPYSIVAADAFADETIAAAHARWPCCLDSLKREPAWHVIDFEAFDLGRLAPPQLAFAGTNSQLRWVAAAPIITATGADRAATVWVGSRPPGTIGTVTFDELAAACWVGLVWPAQATHAEIVVEAYRGLQRISRTAAGGSAARTAAFAFEDPAGITHLVISKVGPADLLSTTAIMSLVSIRYRTVREALAVATDSARCEAADLQVHADGPLAWLPNHDYEIVLGTRIEVDHDPSGSQDTVFEERVRFRTKGPPGLNAVATVGEEIEPYVESVYPRAGMPLYRDESIVLAFDDRWSRYAYVDRTPAASDPIERQQMYEWGIALDEQRGRATFPVTVTAPDWIATHRTPTDPAGPTGPWFAGLLGDKVRRVPITDARRQRLDRMLARPSACDADGGPRASRVLTQAPPVDARGTAAWRPGVALQLNLRGRSTPWVSRMPLEVADAHALTGMAVTGAAAVWVHEAGALRPAASGTLALGAFGEPDWDHVAATVSLASDGTAGIAMGVSLTPALRAVVALLDRSGTTPVLAIVELAGTSETVLASAPCDASVGLLVFAGFDDVWRAELGTVRVEAPRGDVRVGRTALAARDGGGIIGLELHGLDAMRCSIATSRWRNFREHVASFPGTAGTWEPAEIGGAPTSIDALFGSTRADLARVMGATGTAQERDRMFEMWLTGLALPIRERVDRLEVMRYRANGSTHAFLLESPEPFPVGGDIRLTLRSTHNHAAILHHVIRNGSEDRVLVVPVDMSGHSIGSAATMTFELDLRRSRYRGTTADATYVDRATLRVP